MKAPLIAIILTSLASCGPQKATVVTETPSPSPPVPALPPDSPATLSIELGLMPFAVTFRNTGQEPLRILRPLDGSESGWIMPHYKLSVLDYAGREAQRYARCGNFGFPSSGSTWPESYLVTIPPGGTVREWLTHHRQIKVTGTYTLQFQYVFRPDTNETPGGSYPPGLWRGEATSNTVEAIFDTRDGPNYPPYPVPDSPRAFALEKVDAHIGMRDSSMSITMNSLFLAEAVSELDSYPASIRDGIPLVESMVALDNPDGNPMFLTQPVTLDQRYERTSIKRRSGRYSVRISSSWGWVWEPHEEAEASVFPLLDDNPPFAFEREETIRRSGLISALVGARMNKSRPSGAPTD